MAIHSASDREPHAGFRWATSTGDRAHRWLAWSAWLICLAALLSFVPTMKDPTVMDVAEGLSWTIGVLAVATIGALVVSKRKSLVQGWLLVVFGVLWSTGLLIYNYMRLPGVVPSADLAGAQRLVAVADTLTNLGIHAVLLLLLLVPDGRLPAPRWRPMIWLLAASAAFDIWISALLAGRIVDIDAWLTRNTWTSTAGAKESPSDGLVVAVSVLAGLIIVGLLIRALWSRLDAAHRETSQQVKWVVWGTTGIAGWLLIWWPQVDGGWLAQVQRLYPGFALVLLATGFGMALFKYRLWDVDLVVRRSLVYGALWLLIAGVYAGVAAGLGLAAGARFPVGAAIGLTVAATLVFQPARRWMEGIADRMVFGRKGSPVDVIQRFGAGVAASARPDDIASELVTTAARALGLGWVAVEIDGSTPTEVGLLNDESAAVLDVRWGHERFGVLRCRPDRGARLTEEDVALLDALASQAALALSHARLASRMVHAQERERQRIERNIHDGVQQDLATLVARLGVTRARADGDSALTDALGEIQREIQRILAELRELAQGIHPSVLRDGGLVAAIEDRCSRLPIEVNLEVGRGLRDRRLHPEIEAAAFFFAAEAVANTLKHSGADAVDITIQLEATDLRVEVTDAGTGFEPTDMIAGSGITGLSDRIRAVGGSMTLQSRPKHGTVLVAEFPVSAGPDTPP